MQNSRLKVVCKILCSIIVKLDLDGNDRDNVIMLGLHGISKLGA